MTPNSQPSTGSNQGDATYGPPWEGYNFPQGGYGGPQIFPTQQFPGQGPSSPGVPRMPAALPGNIPVIRPTSSDSTPYRQHPGAPGRPPITLQSKRFQPAAELRRTDVAGIGDLPPLPEITCHECDADAESDNTLDLGAMIPPVRTVPVWGRAQSSPVQMEGCTGLDHRLPVLDWTGSVWTSPHTLTNSTWFHSQVSPKT
jgi:hypothetical protein